MKIFRKILTIVRMHPVSAFLAVSTGCVVFMLTFLENQSEGSVAFLEAHLESRNSNLVRLILQGEDEGGEEQSIVRAIPAGFSGRSALPLPPGQWESLRFYFSLSASTGEIGEIQVVDREGKRIRELPLVEWDPVGTIQDFTIVGNKAAYWVLNPQVTFALHFDFKDDPLQVDERRFPWAALVFWPIFLGLAAMTGVYLVLRFLVPGVLCQGSRSVRWIWEKLSRLGAVRLGWLGGFLAVALLFILVLLPAIRSAHVNNAVPLTFVAEIRSDTTGTIQLYYDIGQGLRESHSGKAPYVGDGTWKQIGIQLPPRRIFLLRLDPRNDPGMLALRNMRLLRPDGSEFVSLALEEVSATNQIASLEIIEEGRALKVETTPDAFDPNLLLGGSFPFRDKAGFWMQWNRVIIGMVLGIPLVFLICFGWIVFRAPEAKSSFVARLWRSLACGGWRFVRRYRWLARGNSADFYAVIALGFGLLFCFLTPPYQSPDEYSWFNRAWMISQGGLFPAVEDGKAGGYVPDSFHDVNLRIGYDLPFNPHKKTSWEKLRLADNIPLNPDTVSFKKMGDSTHSLFPYLPQAAGIAIARAFDLSPLKIFYAGRLANLLAGVFIIWLGLRLVPAHRLTLAVLALSPMVVFLSGTNSHDVWTIALTFLFICYLLRIRVSPGMIGWKEITLISAIFLLFISSKFVYLALFPLLLLIPVERFGSEKRRWTVLVGMGVGLLAAFLTWMGSLSFYPHFNYDRELVDTAFQLQKLIQQPVHYLTILFLTARETGSLWIVQAIGILGWMDTDPGSGVRWLFVTALLGALLSDATGRNRQPFSALERILLLGVALLVAALITTLFYLIWTDPDQTRVWGVQGRYFVPLAPVAILAATFGLRRNLLYFVSSRMVVVVLVLIYLGMTAHTLADRYWM